MSARTALLFALPLLTAGNLFAQSNDAPAAAADRKAVNPANKGSYRQVSIAEAQDMARQHHPSMELLKETLEQADVLIWRAYAIVLPSLTVTANVTMADEETAINFGGMKIVTQEKFTENFGVTARMPLFNGQSIPLIKNAYENEEASETQLKYGQNELDFAVLAAGYALQANKEAIDISQASLEIAQQMQAEAEKRVQVGMGVELEVLRAKLQVSQAQKALDESYDSLDLARSSLYYLTGEMIDLPPLADRTAPAGDLQTLQTEAHDNRLDLKAARMQLNMAERLEDQNKWKWAPTIDLTWNFSWTSNGGMTGKQEAWYLILGATWNIFDGGDRIAVQKSTALDTHKAKLNYDKTLIDVDESIEKALVEVKAKERSYQVAQEQAALAEESHKMVTRLYETGMATSLDVSDATSTLRQAKLAVVLAELQRQIAILSLERLLGRTMRA